MLRANTPVEEYLWHGKRAFEKREDLCAEPPMPPLAKLRGIEIHVERLVQAGWMRIGNLDTRVSKSGQGVAAICNAYFPQVSVFLGFPRRKTDGVFWMPASLRAAKEQRAIIWPMPAARLSIMWHRMKKSIEICGGIMLPHGMPFNETVIAVADEAASLPMEVQGGTVVCCTGTGTSLAGVCCGLDILPQRIVGVSAGKDVWQQRTRIEQALLDFKSDKALAVLARLQLVPPLMGYYEVPTYNDAEDAVSSYFPCPFPCHPNYDLKAWLWLDQNIADLPEPILFWNVGA